MNTTEKMASDTAEGGNVLPDLAYVGQLFAALDAAGSAGDTTVVNEALADAAVGVGEIATVSEECRAMNTDVDNGAPLALPAQCLMRDAVEIKATLQTCAERAEVQMDIGAVERVDAAFMQVLLALAKQRKAGGKAAVRFIGVSAALREATQVLGLGDYLQLSEMAA